MPPFRTVIASKRYEEELAALDSNVKRTDEYVDAVVNHMLPEYPEGGLHVGHDVWAVPMFATPKMPRTVIFYTFTSMNVILLSIKVFGE